MSEVTVKELAKVVGATPERLLEQLAEAGVSASSVDASVSDDDKMKLLAHLRKSRASGGEDEAKKPSSRITLKRRSQQEIKVGGSGRGGKTVAVEYRRRKTYVSRDEIQKGEDVAEPVPEEAPVSEAPSEPIEEKRPETPVEPDSIVEESDAEQAVTAEPSSEKHEPEAEAEQAPAEAPVAETPDEPSESAGESEPQASPEAEEGDDARKKSRLRIVAMPEEAPGIPVSADEGKPKRGGKHGGKGRHARENAREELHLGAGAGRRRKKGKKGAASKTAVATRHTSRSRPPRSFATSMFPSRSRSRNWPNAWPSRASTWSRSCSTWA